MQIHDCHIPLYVFTPPLEDDDVSPTPTQRLNDIEPRVAQIETTLGIKPPGPKSILSRLWSRSWPWVVNNKVWIIPITAILVTLSGIRITDIYKEWKERQDEALAHAVDDRIDKALKAPGGVLETLKGIDGKVDKANTTLDTLQPFIHDVIEHQFENVSKLSPQALGSRLPALRDLLAIAKDQDIRVRLPVEDLSRTLRKVQPDADG